MMWHAHTMKNIHVHLRIILNKLIYPIMNQNSAIECPVETQNEGLVFPLTDMIFALMAET